MASSFLYEPSASERWDTFTADRCGAHADVQAARFNGRHPKRCLPGYAGRLRLLLLTLNLAAVRGQVGPGPGNRRAAGDRRADGWRACLAYRPGFRARGGVTRTARHPLVLPGSDPLQAGDVVYLSGGIAAIEGRFGVRCAATDIAGLCRVLP